MPQKLASLLDARADRIRQELEDARKLREEAQTLLARFERQQKEVSGQADAIVAHAKADAERAAEEAKANLKQTIARRMRAAEEQIASAEANAVKEVKDRAVEIAVAAAREVIARHMTEERNDRLVNEAIDVVGERLH